ncbi:hypothetical protein Tco_1003324 [Tanacetum coccineum]|uniref:Uncharacterized protein n=1 Tax=Tanacetum coccineum TaxID=301880 RepID=A0ABQ5F8R9_9ASTR
MKILYVLLETTPDLATRAIETPLSSPMGTMRCLCDPIGAKRMLFPRTSVRGSKLTSQGFSKLPAIGLNVFQHDPSPLERILLPVSLLNSFHQEGMLNFEMTYCCSNNIRVNLYLKHGLVSRTYSKKSFAMVLTSGSKPGSLLRSWPDTRMKDEKTPSSQKGSLYYKNPNVEQLLGVMEYQVDTLMKDTILLMGKSENLCGISSNDLGRFPLKPSHQEAFEGLLINFMIDQEEKVCQLEGYMSIIGSDFMQLSSEVVMKLKEEIRIKENNSKRIQKIMRYLDTEYLRPFNNHKFSESLVKSTSFHASDFISPKSLCVRYDPHHVGLTFRLGGEQWSMSLLEFGWRVGLYSEEQSRLNNTKSGLRRGETVKAEHVLLEFWLTIGNGEFVVGGTSVKEVIDPRVKLAHRFIATTISDRKESTQRIIEIDLFYLYCIYAERVI